jgi:hypothetical protein
MEMKQLESFEAVVRTVSSPGSAFTAHQKPIKAWVPGQKEPYASPLGTSTQRRTWTTP